MTGVMAVFNEQRIYCINGFLNSGARQSNSSKASYRDGERLRGIAVTALFSNPPTAIVFKAQNANGGKARTVYGEPKHSEQLSSLPSVHKVKNLIEHLASMMHQRS